MFNPSKSFLISVASSLVAINLALACVASTDSVDQQVEAKELKGFEKVFLRPGETIIGE
jgi:hypothetical protein